MVKGPWQRAVARQRPLETLRLMKGRKGMGHTEAGSSEGIEGAGINRESAGEAMPCDLLTCAGICTALGCFQFYPEGPVMIAKWHRLFFSSREAGAGDQQKAGPVDQVSGAFAFGLHSCSIHAIQAQLLGQAFSHDIADEAWLTIVVLPGNMHRRTCQPAHNSERDCLGYGPEYGT